LIIPFNGGSQLGTAVDMFEHYKYFPVHIDSPPPKTLELPGQLSLHSALPHPPPMVVRRPPALVTARAAPSMFPLPSTLPHDSPTTWTPPPIRDLP
jgi:hypothetical protein